MFWFGLKRIGLAIFILAAIFWPDYGLGWLSVKYFSVAPIPIIVGDIILALILLLIIPLKVHVFRWVTTGVLLLLEAIFVWQAHSYGIINVFSINGAVICAILVAGSLLGWLLIATPIWRAVTGAVAVDNQSQHDFQHHS